MSFSIGEIALVLIIELLLVVDQVNSHRNKSYNGGAYTFVYPGTEYSYNGYNPMTLSFTDAQRWCEQNVPGSNLLTIADQNMQKDIENFANVVAGKYSYIRVNGRFHSNGSWSWVNGHEFKVDANGGGKSKDGETFQNIAVESQLHTFNEFRPSRTLYMYYICEYPTATAECESRLYGKCLTEKRTGKTWYEARNDCLQKGGDLASFDGLTKSEITSSLQNVTLDYSHVVTIYYWIGIQNGVWRWEDTGSAMKYTSWWNGYPYTDKDRCLCLNGYNEWKWIVCSCVSKFPFVCLLNRTDSSQTTTSNSISDFSFPNSKTATPETTQYEIELESKPASEPSDHQIKSESGALMLGVGISCAAVVTAIVIVVIVIIIQRRKSSRATESAEENAWDKNSNEIQLTTKTIDPKFKNFDEKTRPPPPNEAIYANADSNQMDDAGPVYSNQPPDTIYVSVEPSLEQSPDCNSANSQANNIVYAELDLELNTQREHK